MYDRSYLNFLFKEMRYQDLITGGEEVEDASVKYKSENIMVRPVGDKAIFVAVVRNGALIGLVDLELKDVVEKVREILG
jgi:predicted regulator of Ras-like GTPase activity (Roadblock/LC7/MglB family)